ncbi:cyclic pyranopterin monophosphate synthase MoaC [Catalinimonas niigatensis]|uniref:cyclic pyranopterin monophosphate synthase MoaC n=1 Tax=Catalinimonas niigatensis TaxID=1397264 RepID=UPI002666C930|nr:cyclic pyranopterin monophosphate synthase MoaC [Catalinimonas niigatensis]WPP52697.1 cyclic pyranopterin monophosphate synthase MoaC [Catalinimonas niigatensis]
MTEDNQRLTHLDAKNQPTMVDVGDKAVTQRSATAQCTVVLGKEIMQELTQSGGKEEIYSKKGPVFQTAIIAGTMAVKKCSELIPFCHPLPIEKCKVLIHVNDAQEVVIECTVGVTSKTGVEMEALTGANVAALTIYDMCKALSHDIVIKECKLMTKSGGKRDFSRG